MKRSCFSSLFALADCALAIAGAAMIAACSTPGQPQVAAVQAACAADAAVRPTVTVLLDVPGLATIEERAAVTAARAVIDPICANPATSANALEAITGASGNIVTIVTQLKARKAAAVQSAASGAS